MPAPPLPRFVVQGLRVALAGRLVLDGLSFEVAPGTVTALVGPNGSGKTTLLRALAGLLPHEGRIELDGRGLHAWSDRERARSLAFVQQQTTLSFDLSVREFVALGRMPHRSWLAAPSQTDEACVDAALRATTLTDLQARSARALSGGEHRRLLVAQALAQDTPTLLLDEPTAHLDLRYQLDLTVMLQRLHRDGRTLVVALHELERAAQLADQVLLLRHGRLVAAGPPSDVLTEARLAEVFDVGATVTATPRGLRFDYQLPDAAPRL